MPGCRAGGRDLGLILNSPQLYPRPDGAWDYGGGTTLRLLGGGGGDTEEIVDELLYPCALSFFF